MKTIDFMKHKKLWFSISGIIITIGIVFMILNGGLNFGIDFTGGTSIQADIGRAFNIADVRAITDTFDKEAIVTYAGNENEMALVRTKVELTVEQQGQILKSFTEKFNITQGNIEFETIGPTVGRELQRSALIALFLANIGILLYVSVRFEWKFGIAAIAALIHDVLMMLFIYSIFRIPVNISFIAAILTIVGYSINDTIVVFDRIRENLRNARRPEPNTLVNISLSSTLARSINTSFTTLLVILALYVLGVPAIKDFALPLLVGVLSGTYSSIFIASPVWVLLKEKVKLGESA